MSECIGEAGSKSECVGVEGRGGGTLFSQVSMVA